MRVTFLSETALTSASGSAQIHRLLRLREGLERLGLRTDYLSLREMTFRHPTLLFPLNYLQARAAFGKSDFVHAVGDTAYAAVLWKLFSRRPAVVHDVDADTLAEARLHWERRRRPMTAFYVFQEALMNRVAYRLADYYVTVSVPLLERLSKEKGVPRDRVHLVRNGVDTELFRPSPGNLEQVFTICYAGGTHQWQGLENLAAAAKLLRSEPVRFQIVGFRPEDRMLKKELAASLGDRASLVDRVTQSQLAELISRAHCCIIPRTPHPAVRIAFPTKFSEYLALGKPVIVTDVDETASLVRSHRCGLVSEASVEGLVNTIKEASSLDSRELAAMGERGRNLAETTFDWKVVCKGYANLLQSWHGKKV